MNDLASPTIENITFDELALGQSARQVRTLTVAATVQAKDVATKRVTLDCRIVNQSGDTVLTGTAVVIAPTEKISRPAMHLPQLRMFDPQERHEALLASVSHLAPVRCAVVHACDAGSLAGALDSGKRGLIIPVLVGPEAKLRAAAEEAGRDLQGIEIRSTPHSVAAAVLAAEMAASGDVEALMKGSLHTDELMHAVVGNRVLRTKRRLSHVFRFDVPMYDRPLLITDAALNIRPTLEEKADIIQNAIHLSHALGTAKPNVAILSAVETINTKMQSTLDAAACGVVLGARVPIALTSRADGPNARVASAALTLLLAHRNRKVQP
jgi:phosphate acetyltransferase